MSPEIKKEGRPVGAPGLQDGVVAVAGGSWDRLLTKTEMGGWLQVSVRTVTTMMARGELPFVKLKGRLVRFYLPAVVNKLTGKE
jgi:excisionase family DNA binding protein